jgi:15-cis-phytoene synthase
VAARDTSFYYAFLALPADQRRAIVAVWDFCRAVDDAVDEPGPAPEATLTAWRAELARCYEGQPETPQGRDLQPWIRAFTLSREPFEDLIDGVGMDLRHRRYPTFETLYEYCRRVASTVGLICVEIFGCRDDRSREYAVALGIALQLTNIVRDVKTDLLRGRLYVPLEDLERFHCVEADLETGIVTENVKRLLAFECERARLYYGRAVEALPKSQRRALVAAEIMRVIYFDLLRRIERHGYDVFSGRIRVPRSRRAWLALQVWSRMQVGRVLA